MRILVISNTEWDDGNSFGSTFSNLLSFEDCDNLANIYCRNGSPRTQYCRHFLCMGEKAIWDYLIHSADFQLQHGLPNTENTTKQTAKKTSRIKTFARKHRWLLFFWLRELLWMIAKWKRSKALHLFIEEFKPDLIVLPVYSYSYINKLALYLSQCYKLPLVSYVSDDEYSYNPFRWSPFYHINKWYQRKWIKKGIDKSDILYVISDIQKREYEVFFGQKCKILTKGAIFEQPPTPYSPHQPLRLLFIGNIGTGRWTTLSMLADIIEQINASTKRVELTIYTGTPYTSKMIHALNKKGVHLNGYISPQDAQIIIQNSDVLVHVESFIPKDVFEVHQSFSTKIVDYISFGKCILGIGPKGVASISFLKKHHIALTASNKEEIRTCLLALMNNHQMVTSYASTAWMAGKRVCNIKEIHGGLIRDFESVIKQATQPPLAF